MSDVACIYEMNMLEENAQMEQDILSGRGMDVLLCLMDHLVTGREIARRLGIPNYSVQLYLQRMVNAKLVREDTVVAQDGQIEKNYYLIEDDIEIVNRLERRQFSTAESNRKSDVSAQHFAVMTKNAVKNANANLDKPNKIKAYFMKAQKEDMNQFKKDIEQLFQKYQSLEDSDAENTYSLFTVLAPYEMEG